MSESYPVAAPERRVEPVSDLDIDLTMAEPKADATVPPELQGRRKGVEDKQSLINKEQNRLYGYPYLAQAYAELGEMTTGVSVSEKALLPTPIRVWIKDRAAILSTLAYYREHAPDPESALSNAKNDLEQAVRRGLCQERQRYFADQMEASTRKIQELSRAQLSSVSESEVRTNDQAKIDKLLATFSGKAPMPKIGESQEEVTPPQSVPKKGLLARARELFQ